MEETQHDRIEKKVDNVIKILNGNGQIGLCAKVAILWKSILFVVAAIVLLGLKDFF